MNAFVAGKAESVLAYCRVGIDYHPIACPAPLVNDDIGIQDAIVSDLDIFTDIYAWVDNTAVADFRSVSYCRKFMNMTVRADLGAVGNHRSRADSHFFMLAMTVQ